MLAQYDKIPVIIYKLYLKVKDIYSKIIKETNVSIRAKIQLIYNIRRTIWKNVFILPNN